ncbi:hypothetical protein LBMAG37_13150 [Anaerolineae bacterium]|nr:hypothetical protein LBMAG37_13150 [Anaerolineae bacterium]
MQHQLRRYARAQHFLQQALALQHKQVLGITRAALGLQRAHLFDLGVGGAANHAGGTNRLRATAAEKFAVAAKDGAVKQSGMRK